MEGEFKCVRPSETKFFLRTKACAPGVCTSSLADEAVCDKSSDCVFNGRCYSDIDDVNTSSSLLFGSDRDVWTNSEWKAEVSADVNSNPLTSEFCDPGEWQGSPPGDLTGTVFNVSLAPVAGVSVKVVGTALDDVTNALGAYTITDIPEGTYDLIASKPGDVYEDAIEPDVSIAAFDITVKDITLAHPSEDCNNDCTKADGLCHAECQGKGLCSYVSPETQAACHLAAPGLLDYGTDKILCCSGAIFTPVKADVKACGKNIVSARRPVLFKGQLVNMIVTVFNAGDCGQDS